MGSGVGVLGVVNPCILGTHMVSFGLHSECLLQKYTKAFVLG